MRNLALIAALCSLAGCYAQSVPDPDYQIVAVKSRPAEGYDTLREAYSCIASVQRNIPATRYFRSGRQEEYVIHGVIGTKDICK